MRSLNASSRILLSSARSREPLALLAATQATTSRPRGAFYARVMHNSLAPKRVRAWGMPGARCTRSLICKKVEAYERSHCGLTGFTRHSRTQWFTAYSALFPVIGLCCHRRQRSCLRRLDASVEVSEPHDFAVRLRAVRQPHVSVHRIPSPTSVTIAKRPSCGPGRRGLWI